MSEEFQNKLQEYQELLVPLQERLIIAYNPKTRNVDLLKQDNDYFYSLYNQINDLTVKIIKFLEVYNSKIDFITSEIKEDSEEYMNDGLEEKISNIPLQVNNLVALKDLSENSLKSSLLGLKLFNLTETIFKLERGYKELLPKE